MTTNTTKFESDMNGDTTVDKVQDVAVKAQDKVVETASVAKEQAKRAATQVTEQAKSTVDTRMNEVAQEIGSVADAVRQTSYEVAGENQTVARYGQRLAEQLEGVSTYMNEKGVEDVLTDLQDFARRQPAIFLGGAFMLGMFVGRFVRSSGGRSQPYDEGGYGAYEGNNPSATPRYSTGYGTHYDSQRYQTGINQESTTSQD